MDIHGLAIWLFIVLLLISLSIIYIFFNLYFQTGLFLAASSDFLNPSGVQAISTIALVAITLWYATHTKKNADLSRLQLEIEAKREHGDVLKDRIQEWIDYLPDVGETNVREFDQRSSNEMVVVPKNLHNDTYYIDLTENHIESLRDSVEDIDGYYSEYENLRTQFVENANVPEDSISHSIVLKKNYLTWLFEQLIRIERGISNKDEIVSETENLFKHDYYEEDETIYFVGDYSKDKPIMAYNYQKSMYPNRKNPTWFPIYANIATHQLNNISDINNSNKAKKAGEILDNLDSSITELENELRKYNEYTMFAGECQYVIGLDDVRKQKSD